MSALSDHYVIAGWNGTVPMLLEQLAAEFDDEHDPPRVLVFAPIDRPESLDSRYIFVHGDFTKEIEYAKVRLAYASTVIIVADESLGSVTPATRDATTVLTVFTVRSLERLFEVERAKPLHVCAEIQDPENIAHARVAGADEVIPSALLGNSLLAHTASNPGVAAPLSLLVRMTEHNLYTSLLPDAFAGDPLQFHHVAENAQKKHNVLVIGFVRKGETVINPGPREKVNPDDEIIYIGSHRIRPPKMAFGEPMRGDAEE